MADCRSNTDYRLSHLDEGKGESYDKAFSEKSYRKFIWNWEKQVLHRIIEKFYGGNKEIDYLDFACGTGRIISFMENYVSKSIGVDVSESMLRKGRKKVSKSKLILSDITIKNILIEERYDLITSFRFFLNAQAKLRENVLKELSLLLKKKGCFVFNIHMNNTCILSIMTRLYMKVRSIDSSNFKTISITDINKALSQNGFEVVDIYHKGIIPIKNENTKFPIGILNILEKPFSLIPFFRYFSRYVIFVCRNSSEL